MPGPSATALLCARTCVLQEVPIVCPPRHPAALFALWRPAGCLASCRSPCRSVCSVVTGRVLGFVQVTLPL